MADRGGSALAYDADLTIEVGDSRGSTTAHLGSDHGVLVLDMDDPATMLRCAPALGLLRDLPLEVPRGTFGGTAVRLTSRGRSLGRLRVTPAGTLRVVPTAAGVVVGARALRGVAPVPARTTAWWGAGLVAASVALVVTWRRRRH